MATNVRIQPDSYAKLKQMATDTNVPMPEILAEAIEALYRTRFYDECDRAYARLRADPVAWQEELEERKAWDVTLSDGLEEV